MVSRSCTLQNAAAIANIAQPSHLVIYLPVVIQEKPSNATLDARHEPGSAVAPQHDAYVAQTSWKHGIADPQDQRLKSIVALVEKMHQAVVFEYVSLYHRDVLRDRQEPCKNP